MPLKIKIVLIILFISVSSFGQTEKSFIFHKVVYGESISQLYKKYLVNPKTIYQLNKFAIDGIKKDMILKIPLTDSFLKKNKDFTLDSAQQNEFEQEYNNLTSFEYVAKANENVDAVLAKFSLSFRTLLKYNPQLENVQQDDIVTNFTIPTFDEEEKIDFEEKNYTISNKEIEQKNTVEPNEELQLANQSILETDVQVEKAVEVENEIVIDSSTTLESKDNSDFQKNIITHQVNYGETLFGLSKKYNVKMDKILELNPEIKKKGLLVGNQITIVLHNFETENNGVQNTNNNSNFVEYVVVKGDTLYSLAKKNNTTIEQIFKNNPIVAKNGLIIGQKIKL